MDNDEKRAEYDTLINDFTECRRNNDIEKLCELVEYVRGQGILYQDFPKKNAELLDLLLRTSLDLTRDPSICTLDKPWWFVMEVYDIVFHQVRWGEYPSICADLYFELTHEVLNEKHYKLYKTDSSVESYGMCVYFILMANNWFATRERDFFALYEKLKPIMSEEPDHLEEPWVKRYRELNAS